MNSKSISILLLAASLAPSFANAQSDRSPRGGGPALGSSATNAATGNGSLVQGLAALKASDYTRAEQALSAVRGADQSVAEMAIAHCYFEQGRFEDAEKVLLRAQNNPATKLEAIALRGEILRAVGKTDAAIKLLEPHKDGSGVGGRRVRLALGTTLIDVGRRSDAEPILMKFVEEYNDDSIKRGDAEGYAMVAQALVLLRHPKDANQAFKDSQRAERARVETLFWFGQLFFDHHDPGNAEGVVREALKIAPKRADLLVLLARIKLEESLDFAEAEKLVREALAVHPKHVGAQAVLASIALHDMELDRANAAVDRGMATNPNDLELWSLRAAIRFLADDHAGFEAAKQEVFRRNPKFSQFYGIVGEFAEWEHRYDDIVAMMKEATKIDPEDGKAWAQLGLTEMRGGNETAGLAALNEGWKHDTFNVRAYNTLERLYGDWIPNQYDLKEEGIFKIRYPKAEQPVLERYVPEFVASAWGAMKNHYGFAPRVPLQLELYADRQHFSVRTSGLPNIGIQGVCFGRVVAAMSPQSENFNWGNVVWHEIGHVFAIQLSKNHVPRWFTEGLSEYETIIKRPEWQRELDPELYLALQANLIPSAVDMNRAFTHAGNGLDMGVAYYAASQMIVFTAEEFGMGRIAQALKLWGEGVRTPAVIERAFGVKPADYDARFRAWALKRLERYKNQFIFAPHAKDLDDAKAAAEKNPNQAQAHVDLALSLLRAKKLDEAAAAIKTALARDPKHMGAHFLASKIAEGKHDRAEQKRHVLAIQEAGGDGFTVQMALADIAEDAHDVEGERSALYRAHQFDPTQPDPLRGIIDLAKKEKRTEGVLDALEKLAFIDQHDRRVWRMLLDGLVEAKNWERAVAIGEAALFVDVESAQIHAGFARALAETGKHTRAVFEYESALLCHPKAKEAAEIHSRLAAEYTALGDAARAKEHADQGK